MPIIKHFRPLRPLTQPSTLFSHEHANPCPPYPFSPNLHFPPANTGLYGSSTPQSGNRVSQGKNKGKTLRKWYPNVRLETIRSQALDKEITIRITAAVMRTIRKVGGLDEYLLGEKGARVRELGVFGWRLRWAVVNTPKVRERFAEERRRLGLLPPPSPPSEASEESEVAERIANSAETFEQAWERDASLRRSVKDEMQKTWEETREKEQKFRKHVRTHWETKDGRVYVPPDVRGLPEFNSEAFRSLVPENQQREGAEV